MKNINITLKSNDDDMRLLIDTLACVAYDFKKEKETKSALVKSYIEKEINVIENLMDCLVRSWEPSNLYLD